VMIEEEALILNPLLGARAMWQCAKEYQNCHGEKLGAPIPLLFLVLPLVLHEDTEDLIKRMKSTSGLAYALHHPSKVEGSRKIQGANILLGLRDRCADYTALNWDSLNMAVSSSLLIKHSATNEGFICFEAKGASLPTKIRPVTGSQMSNIVGAAKRLGAWFAKQDVATSLSLLKIRL
jgi:hypothetical protein